MIENQTADIELDNKESNECDSGIDQDSDSDSRQRNEDSDSGSRQRNDDTEGQKGLQRRSPRVRDHQLKVTYQEVKSTSDGRRSNKASSHSNSRGRSPTPGKRD